MSEAAEKAKRKYEKNRQVKRVSFNIENEKELLDFADTIDFSKWVKEKIQQEIDSKPLK